MYNTISQMTVTKHSKQEIPIRFCLHSTYTALVHLIKLNQL